MSVNTCYAIMIQYLLTAKQENEKKSTTFYYLDLFSELLLICYAVGGFHLSTFLLRRVC